MNSSQHASRVSDGIFLPAGWDLDRIDALAEIHGADLGSRNRGGIPASGPVGCGSLEDFDAMLGHEIAREVALTSEEDRLLVLHLAGRRGWECTAGPDIS